MKTLPLISCLMVTPANDERFGFVQKSIGAFLDQTYLNRELVIVLDSPLPKDLKRLLEFTEENPKIRIIENKDKINLGALRNRSISEAKGEIICQWDDDDLHHRERLQYQYSEMDKTKADGVYLQNVIHFFSETKEVYWTNWSHIPHINGHPATLMCKKFDFRYPEHGETSQRSEDVEIHNWLREKKKLIYLNNPVYLYTYIFHGTNIWHHEHHKLVVQKTSESRDFLERHRKEIQEALNEISLAEPQLLVHDKNGLVWGVSHGKVLG